MVMILRGSNLPAFFSASVSSVQLPFMRSRRAIQSSACSCIGMDSQRFSMLASEGLERAWVEAARRPRAAVADCREARTRVLRSMGADMVVGYFIFIFLVDWEKGVLGGVEGKERKWKTDVDAWRAEMGPID
jgi:hypothetical protein